MGVGGNGGRRQWRQAAMEAGGNSRRKLRTLNAVTFAAEISLSSTSSYVCSSIVKTDLATIMMVVKPQLPWFSLKMEISRYRWSKKKDKFSIIQ
jgi:hypothetical protein